MLQRSNPPTQRGLAKSGDDLKGNLAPVVWCGVGWFGFSRSRISSSSCCSSSTSSNLVLGASKGLPCHKAIYQGGKGGNIPWGGRHTGDGTIILYKLQISQSFSKQLSEP